MNTNSLAIAADPSTPAASLRSLYTSGDPAICAAIAANPNTPLDLLLSLAGSFPAAFCNNPVLPLLLLEQPDLPARMPPDTLRRLLSYAGLPSSVLRWIIAHAPPAEADAARLHINIAGEAGADWPELAHQACWPISPPDYSNELLLELTDLGALPLWAREMLATAQDAELRAAIARNPETPRSFLRSLRRAGASGDLRGFVKVQHASDPETLSWLARGNVYARRIAARNPHTPAPILAQLTSDSDTSVRQGLASNPASSPGLLARLLSDRSSDVRQLIARHSRNPQHLERLARDPAFVVRINIARNPHTPPAALERLAADRHPRVRQALARNPNLSTELLTQLADDPDPKVRTMTSHHGQAHMHNSGKEALASSNHDQAQPLQSQPTTPSLTAVNEHAAASLSTTSEELAHLAENPNPRIRRAVAANPSTPPDLLAWLADDESPIVHQGVAQHPAAPPDILERFAKDHTWASYRTRMVVARHPNTPASALAILANDDGVLVRRIAFTNPRTPATARSSMLARSLETCADSSESFYRALALSHPNVPTRAFQNIEQSPDWLQRFAAAQNPSAPAQLLEQLSQDGNRLVRAAARQNLQK